MTSTKTRSRRRSVESTRSDLRAQVARLRLAARCLGFSAVFVGDVPLQAELFDARGRLAEFWCWP